MTKMNGMRLRVPTDCIDAYLICVIRNSKSKYALNPIFGKLILKKYRHPLINAASDGSQCFD